jgi:hypothetical protein
MVNAKLVDHGVPFFGVGVDRVEAGNDANPTIVGSPPAVINPRPEVAGPAFQSATSERRHDKMTVVGKVFRALKSLSAMNPLGGLFRFRGRETSVAPAQQYG